MYNHPFPYDTSCDLIAIYTAVVVEKMNSHTWPYMLHTIDKVAPTPADVYSSDLEACSSRGMACIAPKNPIERSSLRSALEQDDKFKVVGINDNYGADVGIHCFNAACNKRLDLCAIRDQIQRMQHPLLDIDPAIAAEL